MKKQFDIYIKIIVAVAVVLLFNALFSHWYFRIDLTAEKRYTLSDNTKNTLREINDSLYFKVFLEGDLPVSFVRMQKEVRDLLDEFSLYAETYLEYEFIDPAEGDEKEREQTAYFLQSRGITPFTVQEKDDDGKLTQNLIFPGFIASNGKKAVSANLLKNALGMSSDEAVHKSIQSLEYELLNAVKRLTIQEKPKIAFIKGHGELDPMYVFDVQYALSEYYTVEQVIINGDYRILNNYTTLIIAKPQEDFPEEDKFAVDQFIMNGGNVLWLVDPVDANMDSLAYSSAVMALAHPLNLQDQLFKYGVRINYNLVLDNQCVTIPVNVATEGATPQFNPAPWYYFPLMRPSGQSVITNNLNLVAGKFVSVLDTVNSTPKVKKTVLLQSSKYAKILSLPVPVSFSILNQKPDEYFFNSYDQIFGVLLEGKFESVFKNRDVSGFRMPKDMHFKPEGEKAIQVVIADGDVVKNEVKLRGTDTLPYQLGYDRYTQQTFGNKDLILNIVNYMNGGKDLLKLRSRELHIRQLNKNRVTEEKLLWQIVNVALPLLFIVLFGVVYLFIRKRKYTSR